LTDGHICGSRHEHLCNACGRNTYRCCKPECSGLLQFGACFRCWPKRLRAGDAVGRVVLTLLIGLLSFRCSPAVLSIKAQPYGDQKHVVARYRGKTPPDELLWEVCAWRTREPVQATDRAFEADFSCTDGGSARVTLFRAGHEIASATTDRRPAIAGAQW
jgi:hypothetical protein